MDSKMITLHKFKEDWELPSISPFCHKLESFLKLAKLDYQTAVESDPRNSPNKKLPFIDYGDIKIADSQLAINFLIEELGLDIDSHLTNQQKALGRATRLMVEDHLNFILIYQRWIDEKNWKAFKKSLSKMIPLPWLLTHLIRNKVKQTVHLQGISRLPANEVYQSGIEDIKAIENLMNDNCFFLGEAPSTYDCSISAFIEALAAGPFDSPIKEHINSSEKLNGYIARFNQVINKQET
jgi:hypothetical protein